MLVQKIQKNDVITLKLVSGEEIIGYYISEDQEKITLRKPVVPVPTSENTIGLAPFLMSSDYMVNGNGEISFSKHSVITYTKTNKQFGDVYTKQVSGLDMSKEKTQGLIV